jgi:acyl transferase domain-containing protein
MGRRLLADEPAFAAAVAALEPDFVAQVGFSLHDVLAGAEALTGIERIQPVVVGVQLALTALWRSHGVEPDAVIGHSMGEVTAAVVAGALTPAQGLQVIATRSRLMAERADKGAMALLELDAHAVEALIADSPGVTVAVYASPSQTAVAGPIEAVEAVIARATQQNTFARRVDVEVASHHAMMDPILPELREALAGLTPRLPLIPVISTVENAGAAPLFDADHWVANLRNAVRFSQAVATAGATHAASSRSARTRYHQGDFDTPRSPSTGSAHHHSLARCSVITTPSNSHTYPTPPTVRPPHGDCATAPAIDPWRRTRH